MLIPGKLISTIALAVFVTTSFASPSHAQGRDPEKMLERLDTDGSGTVSLAEFVEARSVRSAKRFERRDKNSDGVISADETKGGDKPGKAAMRECMRETLGDSGKPDWEERLAKVDTNQDGAIDQAEFTTAGNARATERFASIDSDASGDITAAEIAAARATSKGNGRPDRKERRAAREQCAQQLGIELKDRKKRPRRNG